MAPAPLAPDQTLAVAADGSVTVDFPLPRFAVSLLTLRPPPPEQAPSGQTGGCACDLGPADDAAPAAALLGAAILALCAPRRRHFR